MVAIDGFASVTVADKAYVVDTTKSTILENGLLDIYHNGDDRWVTLKPYIVWSHRIQRVICVPRWFPTDLASIPSVFRSVLQVNDSHRLAGIVHDFLYCGQHNMKHRYTKKEADLIFLDFMLLCGVPKWKAYPMYLAVKYGGMAAWKSREELFIPLAKRRGYIQKHPELKLTTDIKSHKWLISLD